MPEPHPAAPSQYAWRQNDLTGPRLAPIVNRMVNQNQNTLDRTFAALADPTRRALLARLRQEDGLSVSALAQPFAISLPAVMKHLDVLGAAGLVSRNKIGRTVVCRLEAGPMEDAVTWLRRYERFWDAQLDRLADFVEAQEEDA